MLAALVLAPLEDHTLACVRAASSARRCAIMNLSATNPIADQWMKASGSEQMCRVCPSVCNFCRKHTPGVIDHHARLLPPLPATVSSGNKETVLRSGGVGVVMEALSSVLAAVSNPSTEVLELLSSLRNAGVRGLDVYVCSAGAANLLMGLILIFVYTCEGTLSTSAFHPARASTITLGVPGTLHHLI